MFIGYIVKASHKVKALLLRGGADISTHMRTKHISGGLARAARFQGTRLGLGIRVRLSKKQLVDKRELGFEFGSSKSDKNRDKDKVSSIGMTIGIVVVKQAECVDYVWTFVLLRARTHVLPG